MMALSIRQPWAWLILRAGKDIENRSWPTVPHRRIFIHAAKGMTHAEYDDAREFAYRCGVRNLPLFTDLDRGGIVGTVEIVDCVQAHESPWFCGPYGFVLREARPLPFRPLRGALGFFPVADSAAEQGEAK